MEDLFNTLKLILMLGSGGILGGVLMTYKLKSELVLKTECCSFRNEYAQSTKDMMKDLKQMVETIRSDIYVLRTGKDKSNEQP